MNGHSSFLFCRCKRIHDGTTMSTIVSEHFFARIQCNDMIWPSALTFITRRQLSSSKKKTSKSSSSFAISSKKLRHVEEYRPIVSNHKQYYPDSFIYYRGDHPYGIREYCLVRPSRRHNNDSNTTNDNNTANMNNDIENKDDADVRSQSTSKSDYTPAIITTTAPTVEPLPTNLELLASLHAKRNIIFGANVSSSVMLSSGEDEGDDDSYIRKNKTRVPSVLDLCPVLLHTAIDDCAADGEQPQALSTLHGLCHWVQQCFNDNVEYKHIQSTVINHLREQLKHPDATTDGLVKSASTIGRKMVLAKARQQLECMYAIATNKPRSGHTVVGKRTHSEGAVGWEAVAREFANLDNDDIDISTTTNIDHNRIIVRPSEECLLYRTYAESCDLVRIELLADTSPSYLQSAGGAMARFFIM